MSGFARRRRNVNGMVVLITGASAGIGRALAVALHRRGARLVLAAPPAVTDWILARRRRGDAMSPGDLMIDPAPELP